MKKILHFLALFLLLAGFVLVAPTTTLAKGKPKKAPPIPVDTNDRISAVHLTSVTVSSFSPQKTTEYKVNAQTKITINGQEGKLSGLATGMDVTVTATPNDPTTAQSVDAKTAKH